MPTTPARLRRDTPDQDLQRMAKHGHGVPSQDPRPEAQQPLGEVERLREVQSSFSGGGMLAGIALFASVGVLIAGPLGVVLGCMLGAVAGAYGGVMLSQSMLGKMPALGEADVLR